jgi:hypothetical protein
MYLNEAHWLIGGDELPGVILNVSITVRLEKIFFYDLFIPSRAFSSEEFINPLRTYSF